jgi:hypothetical protein
MRLIQDSEIEDAEVISAIRSIRSKDFGVICREWQPLKDGDASLYEVRAIRGGLPVLTIRTASLRDSALFVAAKATRRGEALDKDWTPT